MTTIITRDGTEIYYKDWGKRPGRTFSHGWPLSADAWDAQLHVPGRATATAWSRTTGVGTAGPASPPHGNDMDGYADDLAAVIEALDLHDATLVGHSTGGGEVARYIGRHGTARVAKAVLISAVPPIMVQIATPIRRACRSTCSTACAQAWSRTARSSTRTWPRRSTAPTGRAPQVSQGVLDQFWLWSMQSGLKNAYESIKAFSETDFTEDLKKIDVPTLVLHGEDDQIVPVKDSAREIGPGSSRTRTEIYYPGAPHGLTDTHAGPVQRRPAGLPA